MRMQNKELPQSKWQDPQQHWRCTEPDPPHFMPQLMKPHQSIKQPAPTLITPQHP